MPHPDDASGRENGGNLDTSAECVSGETSCRYISNGKLGLANYVFYLPENLAASPSCIERSGNCVRRSSTFAHPSSTCLGLSPVNPPHCPGSRTVGSGAFLTRSPGLHPQSPRDSTTERWQGRDQNVPSGNTRFSFPSDSLYVQLFV